MTSVKGYQVFFMFCSVFFMIIGVGLIVLNVSLGSQVEGHEFLMISMAVVCAANAYLVPQFIVNDERVKLIKQKAFSTSYFFIMGYSLLFMILLNTELIHLTALQLLGMFTALIISTVFLLFIFFSRRY